MSRFIVYKETVSDSLSGLMWAQNASVFPLPMTWEEALFTIRKSNAVGLLGYQDWRLPARRELFSLVSHETTNPCLPAGHPFANIFPSYYWTSTSCARLPDQAWYIHFGGARVFKGKKQDSYMVWPVRLAVKHMAASGQQSCFNAHGKRISCQGSGQDGEFWLPTPDGKERFLVKDETIDDTRTGLTWLRDANICGQPVTWTAAFDCVRTMNRKGHHGHADWRVPDIHELESLLDLEEHSPALPKNHGFQAVQDFYWSASTSRYETTYAWCLYLQDGALGVGYKSLAQFHLWPVRGGTGPSRREDVSLLAR